MGRVLRALLLVGPCRFYVACEARGRLPLYWLAGMFGVPTIAGSVGAAVALARGASFSDQFWVWALGGGLAVMGWLVYSLVVIGVLWVRGVAPDEVLAADAATGGRHVAPELTLEWRRRGKDPLVPGSLVAFFGLMSALAVVTMIQATASDRQFARDTAVTTAEVLALERPAWWDKGDGTILVRFSIGAHELRTHISGELGDFELGVGDQLQVEYLRSEPQTAQATATATENRSDLADARWFVVGALLLLMASGIGWVVGRRRHG